MMEHLLGIEDSNKPRTSEDSSISKFQEITPKMNNADYLVAFSGLSKSYCVGLVDMVNSTKISSKMNEIDWCRYYEIFLNSMARILPKFGGKVIKNQGDSLLYYFPETSKSTKSSFSDCIKSSLSMIEERNTICKELSKKRLPMLDFRISLDYGRVVLMTTTESSSYDLIGPPVNMCAKINRLAPNNGIVIGGDLYQNVKAFSNYRFPQKQGFSIGLKYSYPVYGVLRS